MCRLLLVKSDSEFALADELAGLAYIAKHSKEFQGHGWGCAWLENGAWKYYKNIRPIWEDNLEQFGESRLLLAHARSAYKDEGIVVENNMPFHDDRYVFIFNGELRGVRIAEQGRIGAEKIFNFIERFDRGDMLAAMRRGIDVIEKRTKYIRAMNMMIADTESVYVASLFNEDPEYFTLRVSTDNGRLVVASEVLPGDRRWEEIGNRSVQVFGKT
jgi:predicted glutamine amidotransferase